MVNEILTGMILDEENIISLTELGCACKGSREWIAELVEEGILEPLGKNQTEWQFSSISIVRARCARRLQKDLGLNLAGVALALELLDEIAELRQ